jgi:hypothetical protein
MRFMSFGLLGLHQQLHHFLLMQEVYRGDAARTSKNICAGVVYDQYTMRAYQLLVNGTLLQLPDGRARSRSVTGCNRHEKAPIAFATGALQF